MNNKDFFLKEQGKELKKLYKEDEILHSIIKEVREYIEENIKGNYFERFDDDIYKACDDILEILDKVKKI